MRSSVLRRVLGDVIFLAAEALEHRLILHLRQQLEPIMWFISVDLARPAISHGTNERSRRPRHCTRVGCERLSHTREGLTFVSWPIAFTFVIGCRVLIDIPSVMEIICKQVHTL